jgi:D-arabinose 1-dehydrogenase-like Zn-dependent alcohol dehydrogenase
LERIEETIQRYGQYWAQNTERRQIKQKNKTPKTKKISNTDSGACEEQTVLISYKFCLICNDDFLLLY